MNEQELKGILDELFGRVLGCPIESKYIDQYNSVIERLNKYLENRTAQVSNETCIKRMEKLQVAIVKGFERMEEEIDRRLNDNSSCRRDIREN